MHVRNLKSEINFPKTKDWYEVRIFLEKKENFKPEKKGEGLTVTATRVIKYLEVEKCVFSDIEKCLYIIPKKQEKNEH